MTGTLNIQYPNSDYPIINLLPKEGSKGGMLRFDGETDKRRLYFSQYPSNSAAHPETYLFPINTLAEDATEVKYYNIVTNKNPYLAHPVGTCVITSTNTNPSTIFNGGTWSLIDKNFIPWASSSTSLFTVNSTNFTLTSIYVSRATHTRGTMDIIGEFRAASEYNLNNTLFANRLSGPFWYNSDESDNYGTSTNATSGTSDTIRQIHFQASKAWTGETSSVGEGEAFSNMPPYYVAYLQRRVS